MCLNAQTGYFLVPGRFELAARYSYIDPDNPMGLDTNRQHEATFGLNYYIYAHQFSLQRDLGFQLSGEVATVLVSRLHILGPFSRHAWLYLSTFTNRRRTYLFAHFLLQSFRLLPGQYVLLD